MEVKRRNLRVSSYLRRVLFVFSPDEMGGWSVFNASVRLIPFGSLTLGLKKSRRLVIAPASLYVTKPPVDVYAFLSIGLERSDLLTSNPMIVRQKGCTAVTARSILSPT